MADDSIERVRHKVERGETLSEAELEALRRAAQSQGGPTLRLALAHALINAEHPHVALPLLETLRRDHPRDVQVALGLARAYVAVERFGESERALEDALKLNPGDPEAMKGIAVMAMRRGELARARRLIQDVLRVDPIDDEARLLREELTAVELSQVATSPRADLPLFAAALQRRLRDLHVSFEQQSDALLVKLTEDRVARVDLASMYAAYREEAHPLENVVDAIAKELCELASGLPRTADELLANVLPVLRHGEFADQAHGAAHREGPAGLNVFYVLDHPELVRYVPRSMLEELNVGLEALDARAFENLESRPPLPRRVKIQGGMARVVQEDTGLWALCEGDGHDAARLLISARVNLREQLGRGPLRVALGSRELVVVCREDDPAAVAKLESLTEAPNAIPGRFRFGVDGVLARLDD